MNRPPDHDRDEREWQAQERALERERRAAPATHDDPRAERYRPVVRALREPLADGLPPDFAQRVAERARLARQSRAAVDLRLERTLIRVLVAAFALGALVAVALYGSPLWRSLAALASAFGAISGGWLLPALACLGLSWSMDAIRKSAANGGGARLR